MAWQVFKHPIDQLLHDEDTLGRAVLLALTRGCMGFWDLKDLIGDSYSFYEISEAVRRLSRRGLIVRSRTGGVAAARSVFCLTREGRREARKARAFFREVAAAARSIAKDIRRDMDSSVGYKVLPDIAGFLYRMGFIGRRDYDVLTSEPDYDDIFIEIDPKAVEELEKSLADPMSAF